MSGREQMSQFGKAFKTLKEARAHLKKIDPQGYHAFTLKVRKMSKKDFPRRKKLYHVGSSLDYLNFA